MSHLEKSDAFIHGKIGTATIPTLTNTFIRLFADLKKQLSSQIFLIAGALILASCGGTTTTVTTAAPAAPTAIASTGGNGQVTIGWTAVTGAASYNVYYGTSAGVTTANTTKAGITTTSTTISSLVNGTPEYFAVTAVGTGGQSALSSEVSVTPAANNAGLLWSLADLTANAADPNLVIIDVRNSGTAAGAYGAGHITGAINIPTATFDSPIGSTALNPSLAAIVLGDAGVSNTSKILVYGATTDANAGRVFWILEYLGAKDVHILDGGYNAWVAVPNTTQTTANYKTATTFTANLENIKSASKADVVAHYADTTNYSIVDSRNYDDASGATTNGNYVTKHIPNAVSILTQHFTDPDPLQFSRVLPLTSTAGTGCTLTLTASAIVTQTGGVISAATIAAPGAGYSVGSILMVEGGNHAALFKVATVDISGGVTGVTLMAGGGLYVTGTTAATRDYTSLANVLSANGITAGKTIIAHCYVGYRSGLEYFIFRLLGFNVSNYDGSWTEWQADTTPLPFNVGATP